MKTYRLAASAMAIALLVGSAFTVRAELPVPLRIGAEFPDFVLKDTAGQEHRLAHYRDKIVVFNFSSPECPCSRSVEEALGALAAEYRDKNVVVLGVNSNFFMDAETLRDFARISRITYPILKDDDVLLADAVGARVTPEIFVKGKDGKVVFHGPPDNRPNPQGTPTVFYLKDALEALTQGKAIDKPEITPWGCSIRNGETTTPEGEHRDPPAEGSPTPE